MFADIRSAFRMFSASARRLSAAAAFAVAALAAAGPASAADSLAGVVSTVEMLSRLNQPWVQLIDVRSADEYAGRDIRALRGGHIPGAINVPVAGGVDELAAVPAPIRQLDPRKETVVYGHDSVMAAQLAERLRQQGFLQVRVYADAWPVWANTLELPVASERYADVGALRDQLVELQRMVERLSRPALAPQQLGAAR